jgi:hypothetical protein
MFRKSMGSRWLGEVLGEPDLKDFSRRLHDIHCGQPEARFLRQRILLGLSAASE